MLVKKAKLPLATWDVLRACLQEMLVREGESGLPLSNIKRIMRTRFKVDLSETALGHATMSDLFKDVRLQEMCQVRLLENGYFLFADFKAFSQANVYAEVSFPAVQSQSVLSTCTLSTAPLVSREGNTYGNCRPEVQRATMTTWGGDIQFDELCTQGFPIVAVPMHIVVAEQPPLLAWSQAHDSDGQTCCESESLSGSTRSSEGELSAWRTELGRATPQGLSSSTTPRDDLFAPQVAAAVESTENYVLYGGENADLPDHDGHRVMVRNNFASLVSGPERLDSARAKSLPTASCLLAACRFDLGATMSSHVEVDPDYEKGTLCPDADLNLLVGPKQSWPAFDICQTIKVRNTFIEITSPVIGMARHAQSLPTTPWVRTVSTPSRAEFGPTRFTDQILDTLTLASETLQSTSDSLPRQNESLDEAVTHRTDEVFDWIGTPRADKFAWGPQQITVRNTFVHMDSPDSQLDIRSQSLPVSPFLQTFAASYSF
jgi:hypothetical protein